MRKYFTVQACEFNVSTTQDQLTILTLALPVCELLQEAPGTWLAC